MDLPLGQPMSGHGQEASFNSGACQAHLPLPQPEIIPFAFQVPIILEVTILL